MYNFITSILIYLTVPVFWEASLRYNTSALGSGNQGYNLTTRNQVQGFNFSLCWNESNAKSNYSFLIEIFISFPARP